MTITRMNKVSGVKGNSESSYRTGDVNLTPANIGAATASDVQDISNAVSSFNFKSKNIPGGSGVRTATISGATTFQQFLVMTQRCGLFLVWNVNGTLEVVTVLQVSGLSFSVSGKNDIVISWNVSNNLNVAVFSYDSFTLT